MKNKRKRKNRSRTTQTAIRVRGLHRILENQTRITNHESRITNHESRITGVGGKERGDDGSAYSIPRRMSLAAGVAYLLFFLDKEGDLSVAGCYSCVKQS